MRATFETLSKLLEVVNLAVEDERVRVAANRIAHGLVGRMRQIDNRQPAMTEHAAVAAVVKGTGPEPFAIGPAMRDRARHASQCFSIVTGDAADDARYTAHE